MTILGVKSPSPLTLILRGVNPAEVLLVAFQYGDGFHAKEAKQKGIADCVQGIEPHTIDLCYNQKPSLGEVTEWPMVPLSKFATK